MSIIWSVFPTILLPTLGFSELGWFILLYLIAAYIRLYPNNVFDKCKFNGICSILLISVIILSVILIDFIGIKIEFAAKYATYFAGMNKLPILLLSITLFLTFKNLKIKNRKYINIIASTMFGVYLIHDNVLVRPFLWKNVFKNAQMVDSQYLFIHSIFTVFLVFIGCIIIDYLRILLLEKPLFKWLDNREFKLIEKLRDIGIKLLTRLEVL